MKKQDIDHLFKSGLEGFSAQPSPQVWENIQASMAKSKSQRKILFMRVAGIAAALAIAIISAVLIFDKEKVQPTLTNNNTISNTQNKTIQIEGKKALQIQPSDASNIEKERLVVVTNQAQTEWNGKSNIKAIEPSLVEEKDDVQSKAGRTEEFGFLKLKTSSKLVVHAIKENLRSGRNNEPNFEIIESEREIIAMNMQNLPDKNDFNKWKVGVMVSPGYSSHSATYSDDYYRNMNTSASDGNANVAGGISVEYKTNKKWSIESGIYYSQNGQRSSKSGQLFPTSDAQFDAVEDSYYSAIIAVSDGDILLNSTAGVIELNETPSDAKIYTNLSGATERMTTLASSGDYYQVFDFVEVPVYVRYKLLESKFNLQLMGGLSTNFLIGNQVYLEDGGVSQKVGKTSNISSINYSGTVGVGVEYSLGKRLSLSIEPRINYYLSSINKSADVDYRPYRIGVYTGLNYTF